MAQPPPSMYNRQGAVAPTKKLVRSFRIQNQDPVDTTNSGTKQPWDHIELFQFVVSSCEIKKEFTGSCLHTVCTHDCQDSGCKH
mmetsp:Transcript_3035/g.8586  ORF Transcript_3035/g.8586 Transcript_3035/m.8586 type:complete len:84 (-) Transcript_3035:1849-2100(-)